jgi:hypothetical protein
MKITINELRKIIREEVGRMYTIDNAGFGGMGGVSTMQRNKNVPLPGLGDEGEEEQETHGEEQEKPQWTVRVRNRNVRER